MAHPESRLVARYCVINLGCKVNRAEADTIAASCLAAGAHEAPPQQADVVIVNTCTVTAEADAKTRKAVRRAVRQCAPRGARVVVTGCAAAIDRASLEQLACPAPGSAAAHAGGGAGEAGNAPDAPMPPGSSDAPETLIVEPVQFKATQIALELLSQARERRALSEHGIHPGSPGHPASFVHPTPAGIATSSRAARATTLESTSPVAIKLRAGDAFKTRMDIKIQDGCDNRCTFCIVSTARGPARSVAADAALAEVRTAAQAGVNEVILTGINVGSYSSDGLDLAALIAQMIEQLEQLGSPCRIRVSSIEPQHVTPGLAQVLAEHPGRLCGHVHLPLQAGCDKTLAAMGRQYDTALFAQKVQLLRQALPGVAITTDVIAGFPQESDADFGQSLAFCRQMRFARMHVFRYSRRLGTPAAGMDGQVAPRVASQRAGRLRQLSRTMAQADLRLRVGTCEQVLMISGQQGVSDSYHDVRVQARNAGEKGVGGDDGDADAATAPVVAQGALVPVRFTGIEDGCLVGSPL